MRATWMRSFVPFVIGIVFALGLGLSGMTQADKVIDFLHPGRDGIRAWRS